MRHPVRSRMLHGLFSALEAIDNGWSDFWALDRFPGLFLLDELRKLLE